MRGYSLQLQSVFEGNSSKVRDCFDESKVFTFPSDYAEAAWSGTASLGDFETSVFENAFCGIQHLRSVHRLSSRPSERWAESHINVQRNP